MLPVMSDEEFRYYVYGSVFIVWCLAILVVICIATGIEPEFPIIVITR